MIGRVAGVLVYKAADHVLIDVRGVGYIVFVSERVMAGLPAAGEAVALFTDLLVREDVLQLFGFSTLVEKEWHRLLMSVQGIGAKASLAILGTLGADGVSRAIAMGDWAAVATAKGVGPKTAQKVILDLKDKAHGVMALAGFAPAAGGEATAPADAATAAGMASEEGAVIESGAAQASQAEYGAAQADALSALGHLGYGPSDAARAVAQAASQSEAADAETLIRAALKLLAPKG